MHRALTRTQVARGFNNGLVSTRASHLSSSMRFQQLSCSRGFHQNRSRFGGSDQKVNFDTPTQTKSKRYIAIGACAVVAFVLISEVSYQLMPELSLGNVWRKGIYGDPFRNYYNLIRGKVLYLTLPEEFQIAETESELRGNNESGDDDDANERIIYISPERKFHLIIPKYFVPLGLNIVEHTANIRGYSSMSVKDMVGNQISVEWQRAVPLFDKIELSIYTPMNEALPHIAHYFMNQLENTMDEVHVQRIEYIGAGLDESNNTPKPLNPVPYFPEKKIAHNDLFVVVTKARKKNVEGWQGHIFSVEYPYVYRITIDLPEDVYEAAQKGTRLNGAQLDQIARSYTNVKKLQPIVKENFRYPTADPKEIGLLLRNRLLAIYHNSFYTVPEPKSE